MSIHSFEFLLSKNKEKEFIKKLADECTLQQLIELCVGMEKENIHDKKRDMYLKSERKYIDREKMNQWNKETHKRKMYFAVFLWQKIKKNRYSEWNELFQGGIVAAGVAAIGVGGVEIVTQGYTINTSGKNNTVADIWQQYISDYKNCIISVCKEYEGDNKKGLVDPIFAVFNPVLSILTSNIRRREARIGDI